MRRLAIVLLSLGVVFGFTMGAARLHFAHHFRHLHHSLADGADDDWELSPVEEHLAHICAEAQRKVNLDEAAKAH